MDRKQEYDTLMQELRQTPPALEGTLDRALDRRRARRRKLRPLRSLAAAAAVFVLLVNVSIPFAQACTHIPVLGWLAQAVCFSHSLSSAVEHDWVQKVEQTQRDNGYTLTLEDLIVDQKQIHLFYTLDWEDPACEYAMVLVDGDRLSPRPTVLSDSVEGPQDAGHIVLDYREGQVPDRLDLVLTVRPNGDGSPAARFRFQVALDPSLTAVGQVPAGGAVGGAGRTADLCGLPGDLSHPCPAAAERPPGQHRPAGQPAVSSGGRDGAAL